MGRKKGHLGIAAVGNVRGVMRTYWDTRRGWITQRWPRRRGSPKNVKISEKVEAFSRASRNIKFLAPEDRIAAELLAAHTSYTWRDLAMKAAFGTLWVIKDTDGNIWKGWLVANAEIQALLDTIVNTPGSILVRSTTGWVGLLPPAATPKQLMYLGGAEPIDWQDPPVPPDVPTIPQQLFLYDPPSAADFTLFGTNGTNPQVADAPNAGMRMRFGGLPATGDNVRMALLAIDPTKTTVLTVVLYPYVPANRYNGYGICIFGTGVGAGPRTIITFGMRNKDIGGVAYPPVLAVDEWTNQTTFATTALEVPTIGTPLTFHITLTPTTYRMAAGPAPGNALTFLGPVTYAGFIAPTHIGYWLTRNPTDTIWPGNQTQLIVTYQLLTIT